MLTCGLVGLYAGDVGEYWIKRVRKYRINVCCFRFVPVGLLGNMQEKSESTRASKTD